MCRPGSISALILVSESRDGLAGLPPCHQTGSCPSKHSASSMCTPGYTDRNMTLRQRQQKKSRHFGSVHVCPHHSWKPAILGKILRTDLTEFNEELIKELLSTALRFWHLNLMLTSHNPPFLRSKNIKKNGVGFALHFAVFCSQRYKHWMKWNTVSTWMHPRIETLINYWSAIRVLLCLLQKASTT